MKDYQAEFDTLVEHSDLSHAQQQDLLQVYPKLRRTQQEVVKLHANAALNVLLERTLEVFHQEIAVKDYDNAEDNAYLAQKLDAMLTRIGLKGNSTAIDALQLHQWRQHYLHYFQFSEELSSLSQQNIIGLAANIKPACHNSSTLYSAEEEMDFSAMRELITRHANAYESEIYEFIHYCEHMADSAEASHYMKKIWLWRDGVIEGQFPPFPDIEGFPLPSAMLAKASLGAHPLLEKVHTISDKLERYVTLQQLDEVVELHSLRIIESGQKSLGRIIEKAASKDKLPSDLHDLARAMLVTKDVHNIARFTDIMEQQLESYQHCESSTIENEGWHMRRQGYCDNRITASFMVDGQKVNIESQMKLPEQRRAEMKSHRIYEFRREWFHENRLTEMLEDNSVFQGLIQEYADLMGILKPHQDKFSSNLIKRYVEDMRHIMPSTQPIMQEFWQDVVNFRPIEPATALQLSSEERQDLLNMLSDGLNDLHAIYHIAAAQKSGGTSAALYRLLYERDVKPHDRWAEALENLLPQQDQTPDLPYTHYQRDRGVYSEEQMELVMEELKIDAPSCEQEQSRLRIVR